MRIAICIYLHYHMAAQETELAGSAFKHRSVLVVGFAETIVLYRLVRHFYLVEVGCRFLAYAHHEFLLLVLAKTFGKYGEVNIGRKAFNKPISL